MESIWEKLEDVFGYDGGELTLRFYPPDAVVINDDGDETWWPGHWKVKTGDCIGEGDTVEAAIQDLLSDVGEGLRRNDALQTRDGRTLL